VLSSLKNGSMFDLKHVLADENEELMGFEKV
jgi:hypothetical protein